MSGPRSGIFIASLQVAAFFFGHLDGCLPNIGLVQTPLRSNAMSVIYLVVLLVLFSIALTFDIRR
jgi:hypothetical protein